MYCWEYKQICGPTQTCWGQNKHISPSIHPLHPLFFSLHIQIMSWQWDITCSCCLSFCSRHWQRLKLQSALRHTCFISHSRGKSESDGLSLEELWPLLLLLRSLLKNKPFRTNILRHVLQFTHWAYRTTQTVLSLSICVSHHCYKHFKIYNLQWSLIYRGWYIP